MRSVCSKGSNSGLGPRMVSNSGKKISEFSRDPPTDTTMDVKRCCSMNSKCEVTNTAVHTRRPMSPLMMASVVTSKDILNLLSLLPIAHKKLVMINRMFLLIMMKCKAPNVPLKAFTSTRHINNKLVKALNNGQSSLVHCIEMDATRAAAIIVRINWAASSLSSSKNWLK